MAEVFLPFVFFPSKLMTIIGVEERFQSSPSSYLGRVKLLMNSTQSLIDS